LKIGIIGKGNVGTALNKGLGGKHEIRFGSLDPAEPVGEAAKWAEVVILAVPYHNAASALEEIKPYVDGKTVIDLMNPLGPKMEFDIDCNTSSAEQTQAELPKAHVVKAFNTVFAPNQSTAKIGSEQLTAFIAGDDLEAKKVVSQLTRDIGFDPVDSGPLKTARFLEAMGNMIINMAFTYGMGNKIGYKLVKAPT
jgi:8-hydroxy-5-deazaflavin:NADPH oxidoreductase